MLVGMCDWLVCGLCGVECEIQFQYVYVWFVEYVELVVCCVCGDELCDCVWCQMVCFCDVFDLVCGGGWCDFWIEVVC